MKTRIEVAITGTGLAVPGLTAADELLGVRREGGFDPTTALVGRDLRHKDRATRLALRAVEPALRDAGLLDSDDAFTVPPDAIAVVVSSNLGNLDSVCRMTDLIAEETVEALNPLVLPQTSSNVIAGAVAIRYGLRGPNLTLCNGETGGLDAVHWAHTLIAAGRARVAVVVGVEPADGVVAKFVGAGVVDGAVALVLEDASVARGARARAIVKGYGYGVDRAKVIAQALGGDEPGLWLTNDDAAVAQLSDVDRFDLEARLGKCSGALGVLQCAAAVAHLDHDPDRPVLATITGTDETAALLLAAPVR
jgi:3-oxoacyl-[acyl-carrier-protein] synthase II